MDAIIHTATQLQGTLSVPPDKAIIHRAVLTAALASGATTLRPWPQAEDCQRTLQAVRALGVETHQEEDALVLQGRGTAQLRPAAGPIECGESGTTLRLTAGVLAGQPFSSILAAASSLSRRPMRRITEPLSQMGAYIEGAQGPGAREVYPPLTIHGRRPLKALRYTLPVASAQVKSAVLLAGLFAAGRTTVVEPYPTRDHTERALRAFGITVSRHGPEVAVEPGALTSPGTLHIPGDFSSAAFFIVAALCVPGAALTLRGVSLNPTRTGLLTVLQRMGAALDIAPTEEGWEPSGTITARASRLKAVTVAPAEVPGIIDELPILMVAAACAEGVSRFQGLAELRVKETDRIASMVEGLRRLGVTLRTPASDAVEIEGKAALRGEVVDSAGDHRTAMSLAVAGLVAQGTTQVKGAGCVTKSFPDFFDRLQPLAGGPSTVKTVDKA